MGGLTAGSASAADLGDNCCADLEDGGIGTLASHFEVKRTATISPGRYA